MPTHNIARSEKTEMYLKAILLTQTDSPPPTVSKIADFLGVSLPSVSEMLKRLEQNGLVQPGGEGIALTPAGETTARRVVRRMRLAERFLADILDYPLSRVYDDACKLEHVMSDEMEERLTALLGDPKTCPHGYLIPGRAAADDGSPKYLQGARSLVELSAGDRAYVLTVPEQDSEFLAYLDRMGLVPGKEILVEEVAPFNGPLFLRLAGVQQILGREAAERIRVRPLQERGPEP